MNSTSRLGLVFSFVTASLSAQNVLQEVFNPENGRRYVLLQESSWSAAEARAVAVGGHLATIRSYEEQHFLIEAFQSTARSRFWIGLSDQAQEGTYVWTSGEPLRYFDWNATWFPGQGTADEDFVGIDLSWYQSHWDEVADGASGFHGIVELPVPELLHAARNPANGNYCFLVAPGRWTALEAFAQSLGGHLATVRDAAEQSWLMQEFGSYRGAAIDLFLGYHDQRIEGQFEWASGVSYTYANWLTGEPNNAGGNEHFTVMLAQSGLWNDVPDDRGNGFGAYGIVEIEAVTFGSGGFGCSNGSGAGQVELRAFQSPLAGRRITLRFEDDRGPCCDPVFFAGGLSNTSWNGVPLPLIIPGTLCSIQVSPDVFVQGVGISGWYARLHLPVTDLPIFRGVPVYWQGVSVHPGSFFTPVATTNWISITN